MITKEQEQIIEQEAITLFEKLETSPQIAVVQNDDESIVVEVKMDTPEMFIGEGGQTLLEIQHVLRALVRKKLNQPMRLAMDINEYRKGKETYLRQQAIAVADEVALLGKEKELPPMNASDRRVVHVAISQRQDVISESIGEEPERRVIVKPKTS